MNIQAESSLEMLAPCKAVWEKVVDLAERPGMKSWSPQSGTWPSETASARVVMDKGAVDMVRTETVVRMVPGRRFLVKVEAPESGTLAWLDHRLADSKAGCELTMSVIVSVDGAHAASIDRSAYASATTDALAQSLTAYRAKFAHPDQAEDGSGVRD